uniref:Uncharacterized protein n=1 Tax=Panagrolaimus davidi TaxID=227884 RepID=A0A914Q1G2_9BILA
MVEAAIVEIDGTEQNVINICKQELLTIIRQELGSFSDIFANNAESYKMITAAGILLLDLCRADKYDPYVTLLTSFFIKENAFCISFLPPMTLNLRQSRPGKDKRILNSAFQAAFKYFALYFGSVALTKSAQSNFIENLREKYNVEVQNYTSSQKGYKKSTDLIPHFTIDNSFEATL